jgi:hypothetical protein
VAIEKHKSDLKGVPEALRSETTNLRAHVSRLEFLSRLEGLKEGLAQASESARPPTSNNGENASGDGEAKKHERELQNNGTIAILCEAEDAELDLQLQQLNEAVEVRNTTVSARHQLKTKSEM